MKHISIVVLTLAIISSGCANPINMVTADKYFHAARNSEDSGDWDNAAMYYSRAWGNAKMGNAHPVPTAWLRYDYGRALGVICEWDESEKALNEAYMTLHANGVKDASWALIELERLNFAQEKYNEALSYFNMVLPLLDETVDPLGYADLLDEYVLVLIKTGNPQEAEVQKERAKNIRDAFPGKTARTDITPYGSKCKQDNP